MSVIPTFNQYSTNSLAITSWAEEDRPREKLLLKGRQQLSDAELVAILLGSGSRHESALGLAQRILQAVDNNLHTLSKQTCADLLKFPGIGEAKAVSIIAALELGRRRQLTPLSDRPQVRKSADAYHCLAPLIADLDHEECWMLCLNRANYVTQRIQISTGGRTSTIVDAKVVFGRALEARASAIVIAHNHPSTSLTPSKADIDITLGSYGSNTERGFSLAEAGLASSNVRAR